MRAMIAGCFVLLALPAVASERDDAETRIRAVIDRWYEELRKGEDGRPDLLVGPAFINASPWYRHVDTGAASLGPRVYVSLAATALEFRHEIERMRIDPNFATVAVLERAYSFAWAAQKTTERHGHTDMILERSEKDGAWRIVGHRTGGYGIAPNRRTDPMPDLKDLFYATIGADRDPEADAKAATGKF
jgi:hypothetical protein